MISIILSFRNLMWSIRNASYFSFSKFEFSVKLKTAIMFVKIGLIFLRPVKIGRWQTSLPSLPHCAAPVHHFNNRSIKSRVTVRKHRIWVKIGNILSRATLKYDGWPWKPIMHLFYATSSFMHHFIAIGQFKLELQSGNAKLGSKSVIFCPVRPWNLTGDLEKH